MKESLLRKFVAQAETALDALEERVVAMESAPGDEELLNGVFRSVHKLKGDATVVGMEAAAEVAHHVEDLLDRIRSRKIPVTPGAVSVLLRSLDLLRETLPGRGARAAGAAAGPRASLGPGRTVPVEAEKLDQLLNLLGEVAIARNRFSYLLARGEEAGREALLAAYDEAERRYMDIQELVMRARMVPVAPLFRQYVRAVRDMALMCGKSVSLALEGESVEVDHAVAEQLKDPLTHLIRNAVDHGIEAPEERRARGKDPAGKLALSARHEAGSLVIRLSDDGGGLDRERILEKARALGWVPPGEAPSEERLWGFIFEPGFSTAREVSQLSGRGVGMDIVRKAVQGLGGKVELDSRPGAGTAVTLRLPLTLAIIEGFHMGVGAETFIAPLDAVVECLELDRAEAARGAPSGVLSVRGAPLPYLRLRDHFGLGGAPAAREHVLVVGHGAERAGLVVDALHGGGQAVIKPLGPLFRGLSGVSGSSILGDGRVALILDVPGILKDAARGGSSDPARAA